MKLKSYNKNSRLGFSIALITLLALSLVAFLNLNELIQKNKEVITSKSMLLRLENVFSYLKDTESSERGYTLTGDENFIQPYKIYKDSLQSNLAFLYQFSDRDILHSIHLDSLSSLIDQRIHIIDAQLNNTKTGAGYDAALSFAGRNIMIRIKDMIYHLRAKEEELLQSKINANNASARFTSIFTISFSMAAIILAILAFVKIDKNFRAIKRAETTLKDQKEGLISYQKALQGILNISTNGIMLFDAIRNKENQIVDFRLLIINPAAKKMLNLEDIIVGKNINEVFPIFRKNGLFEKYAKVVETKEQLDMEYFAEAFKRWFQISAINLEDGIVVTFSDIHERKTSEEILLESKLKFEAIFNQTNQFMALLDQDGKYMDVNQTIINFTNTPRSDFFNKEFGFSPVWSKEEKEKLHTAIQKAAKGENVREQARLITSGNQEKIIDITIKPFSYNSGKINFLMVEGKDITDIVKANEEIKGKNRLIEGILDNFHMILMKIDKSGIVSHMSGSGLKVLGIKENELVGSKILDTFPHVEYELNKVIQGETMNFEGKVKVGDSYHYFFNYYFLDDANNSVVGITVDVTPQKEAEQEIRIKNIELSEALNMLTVTEEHLKKVNEELELRVKERTIELQESEETLQQTLEQALELNELLKERELFLSSIIDQSPVSTCITDAEGTQIRVNDACLKLFNVPDVSLGYGKYNILKDELLQKHPAYKDIQEVYSKGKMVQFEIDYDLNKVSHVDITTSYPLSLVATMFPIINRHGNVTNAIVQHQDITEQKQAIGKIKESAERFRLLLETIPQMAFTTQPDGATSYFNERWYQYTGLSFEDSIRMGWKKIIHPDDLPSVEAKWNHSVETGILYEKENRFKRSKDAIYRWHLTRAVPIKDASENIILWVGTCTDIHDHRIAEEQLRNKNLELTKINADLDNFIYTASHDLKAPVTNLEGLISLLNNQLKNELDEKDEKLFNMMKISISKFKNTIAGLVEITKAQKNLEEADEIVSIPNVIQDVLLNIDHLVKDSNAKIKQDLKVLEMKYAKVNMNSILYNLISNAIKYRSPERELVIHIRTYTSRGKHVLTVEDNGMGIRKNQQPKLFTMFKRLHTHVEGTGIGLYIIKRIVENNGGKISVESEEGKGTKFVIYF